MKLFDVFELYDIDIIKGQGSYVWDSNGKKYLDFYGGHAVISVGHSHPLYVKKMKEQLNSISFYSNSVKNPQQQEFADKLGAISGYNEYSLFLINSGAEANENALKLASFYNGKSKVLSFKGGFYGRTSAAARVTDNPRIIAPINMGLDVTFVDLNDINSVEKELKKGNISSVIIEGIQGVGGINVPTIAFLQKLREICTKYNVILIVDEIQSGYGRTGKFFAHQYANIKPDIITVAKGIANGFPMAAVLISPIFEPKVGILGTTFGGNHLACAAANAVLDIFKQEDLLQNVNIVSDFLLNELYRLDGIKEVRGKGLMIGLEFEYPSKKIRDYLLYNENIFTGFSGSNVIRLLPPLTLSINEANIFVNSLQKAMSCINEK